MHVRLGDLVQLISGSEKGHQGRVIAVDHKNNRVKVEGARIVTRHVKPTSDRQGQIVKKEGYLPACKVQPVDPQTGKPTRIAMRIIDGQKVRVGVKSGAPIPTQKREYTKAG